MRKLFVIILLLVGKSSVFGSHIVGGEFELLHLQDFQFRLNMVVYFDAINGAPSIEETETSVTVYIYDKATNELKGHYVLTRSSNELVPYTNADCDDGQLITKRFFYTSEISLPEEEFNNEAGYYIAWERCCRNYTITNIFSDIPGSGISAGQTFYLEFPPVVKNGLPFINSTPRLFPPLRDYGCINNFYFADFGGIDDDGDSLVYSLVTPFSTVDTQNAFPNSPNPAPYPEIVWREGYDLDNIVRGNPDMEITQRGVLSVTPQAAGLYVFAVKVEEFRDGIKHGEMRRDFQMLVVTDCGSSDPPEILAREKNESEFYEEGSQLIFDFNDDEKCVDILVTDPPTGIGRDSISTVTLRAIPINFNETLEAITIDFSQNATLRSELDTARFSVCFPNCPYTRSGIYQIGIIGLDGSCPQPALDTVIVTLNVPPPPNQNARFKVDQVERTRSVTLVADNPDVASLNSWTLSSFDVDGDSVNLSFEPLGFDPSLAGISVSDIIYENGESFTTITWSTDCLDEGLDFSQGRDVATTTGVTKAFDFIAVAEDFDQCEWEDPQQLRVTLLINFPDQTKPVIFPQSQPGASYLKLNYSYNQLINLGVRSSDADGDNIRMTGTPLNFTFESVEASFNATEGPGNPGLQSNFLWDIPCQFEAEIDSFRVRFLVEDFDDCQLTNADTLDVDFIIKPPVNNPPQIFVSSQNDLDIINDTLKVVVNEPIELSVRVLDSEGDTVLLDLFERNPDDPFVFESAFGRAPVQSIFTWTPNCNDLTGSDFTRDVELTFTAIDRNCFEPLGTAYSMVIHVEDVDAGKTTILPPNIFTPNGDSKNDFFGMYELNENGELQNILPIDNCAGQFEEVVIINRWGREVYRSNNREFRWDGEGANAGVYFYQINYTNREYRGSVSVLF